MTDIHTCSYECERPGCIRAQRDELAARLEALTAAQRPAEDGCHCATCTCEPNMTPAVRFDLSPAQKEGAIREHLIRLGWTPPDERAQQPAAVDEAMVDRACDAYVQIADDCMGLVRRKAMAAALTAALAAQHQEPKS